MSCPICDKATSPEFKPFCSRRCADVDLGKWLTGSYAIPSTEMEDERTEPDEGATRTIRPDA